MKGKKSSRLKASTVYFRHYIGFFKQNMQPIKIRRGILGITSQKSCLTATTVAERINVKDFHCSIWQTVQPKCV